MNNLQNGLTMMVCRQIALVNTGENLHFGLDNSIGLFGASTMSKLQSDTDESSENSLGTVTV